MKIGVLAHAFPQDTPDDDDEWYDVCAEQCGIADDLVDIASVISTAPEGSTSVEITAGCAYLFVGAPEALTVEVVLRVSLGERTPSPVTFK